MATSSSSSTTNEAKKSSTLFVSCLKGAEALLARELKTFGIAFAKLAPRGVIIPKASFDEAMRICYGSRLAMRVFWQLHGFRLWKAQNLYQQLVKQPWEDYFINPEDKSLRTFVIGVTGNNPHFPNTHFAAQRAKDAICDYLREKVGKRPSVDKENPDLRFTLHLEQEHITLYFDFSGAPLNQRGYRESTHEAPLNEVVAASLLTLAGYDGFRPFCDPCCGSGTLLTEAAMIASKIPPGFLRKFYGFQLLSHYDKESFKQIKSTLDKEIKPLEEGFILGIDKDRESLEVAKFSFEKLGVKAFKLIATPFQNVKPDKSYFTLTNPPFGVRLDQSKGLLPKLYADLGLFCKSYSSRAFVFSSNETLLESVGLPSSQRYEIQYSGLVCYLWRYKLT